MVGSDLQPRQEAGETTIFRLLGAAGFPQGTAKPPIAFEGRHLDNAAAGVGVDEAGQNLHRQDRVGRGEVQPPRHGRAGSASWDR